MSPTDVDRMLAERYGRTGTVRRRTLWWVAVAVVAIVATGLLGWSTVTRSLASVDADTTGYNIDDEHLVTVRAQINFNGDGPIACAFEAQDTEHGIVGWRVVEYAASEERSRTVVEQVPTVAEATTGLIRSCWTP
ncbi:DUF4307 domain-containing protein [Microbacterium dauci]|uniref:DUF4307 domain-containing protein n=1 Tax=Microbacterium dauci TaxID=3048008 RepID=A0ABT6ZB89_9MICO|nr:DUF4307 domain-containing protein [Microbacterium sp. LX3-4]MDJ1113419.1 DUF4307 domain-containing protein [Microbacterium sp. LX3-4]